MATSDELKKGINKVDEKTHELIMEFHSHYEEYVKLKPEDKNRKDEIYQAWVIQKIAGLQVEAWGRATISNCFCMENEVKT